MKLMRSCIPSYCSETFKQTSIFYLLNKCGNGHVRNWACAEVGLCGFGTCGSGTCGSGPVRKWACAELGLCVNGPVRKWSCAELTASRPSRLLTAVRCQGPNRSPSQVLPMYAELAVSCNGWRNEAQMKPSILRLTCEDRKMALAMRYGQVG